MRTSTSSPTAGAHVGMPRSVRYTTVSAVNPAVSLLVT
jgi:hypothetical protein